MLSNEIQTAIYTELKASTELSALIVDVYDNNPLQGSAQDPAKFPFVVIGRDSYIDSSTNCSTGFDGNIEIRAHARSEAGFREVKQVESAIYKALNRATLAVDNALFIGLTYVNTPAYFVEPDGMTQTAITNFRILVDNNA